MKTVEEIYARPEIKVLVDLLRLSNMETFRHSFSVANLVREMLQYLPYEESYKDEIITGALLHDIGKMFVPFNLTQFPGSLSKQEYDLIKVHTAVSYEITQSVFSETVKNICLYHHERPNGTGYLSGAVLSSIPTEALIVQVADVYDALTSPRVYKKEYSKEQALDIMREDAEKYLLDDQYVSILENIIQKRRDNDVSEKL